MSTGRSKSPGPVPKRQAAHEGPARHSAADADDPHAIASLEYRCRRLSDNLRESLGVDGCAALLARALAECEKQHPALKSMRGPDEREIQLQGVPAATAVHGLRTVEAAIEALQMSLAGILARLIGEDMAMRLMDLEAPSSGETGQEL
jgi:hypothetical protein